VTSSTDQQIGTNILAALAVAGSCAAAAQAEAFTRRDDLARMAGHRDFAHLCGTEAAAANVLILSFPQPLTALAPANDEAFIKLPRETTEREHIVGELRKFGLLEAGWDGEGADAPNRDSLTDAENFVHALSLEVPPPEPMLHANGRAGLYWNDGRLYADLEFLGDGRVSYYVERRDEGKHKGAVKIRTKEMPAVFEALLRA
jgi:hypothetical protein